MIEYTSIVPNEKIEEICTKLEQYVSYYVYISASPVYETVVERMRAALIKLKPFLKAAAPIIAQLVLAVLGLALIPILGPFGPIIVQAVGQLIMYVIKMVLGSVGDEKLLHNPFAAIAHNNL